MKYKDKFISFAIVVVASAGFLVSNASGNSLILDLSPYQYGVGGEFNAYSTTLNPTSMGYSPLTMLNVGHGLGI